MIDIHSHILPGFDDGARDWQTAVAMCRKAAADGIKGMVATPHFYRGLFPTPTVENVYAALLRLQGHCRKHVDPEFAVYLGADCHLHETIIENVRDGKVPTLNGSRYLLLELPDTNLPSRLTSLIFDMCMQHTIPIITHPERNQAFVRHPDALYDLLRSGAFAQVTAGSLTGLFGDRALRAARLMLEHGLVQLIASDAHDPKRRPPILSEGVAAAAEIVGDELARQMVTVNPHRILENGEISFPDPVRPQTAKRSWWQRLIAG